MAFLDKNGLSRLWAHIIANLGEKVDKIDGKGLSANDYTNEDKTKLNTVADDLSVTVDLLNEHLSIDHVTTYNGLTGDIVVPQPNLSQTDETAPDFIKNKPTENDAIQVAIETELISPIATASGELLLDKNNTVFTL